MSADAHYEQFGIKRLYVCQTKETSWHNTFNWTQNLQIKLRFYSLRLAAAATGSVKQLLVEIITTAADAKQQLHWVRLYMQFFTGLTFWKYPAGLQ